jgi:DNA-directed RNA polymerase subunit H
MRKIAIKTLRDQGYNVPQEAETEDVKDENMYFDNILVYFEQSNDFTKKTLESRVNQLKKDYPDAEKIIFILKTDKKIKINKFVVNALTEINKGDLQVEVLDNIYPFDIMKSNLMPEAKLLTEEERDQVVDLSKTPLNKFPKLLVSDPLSKRFGAKPGDMIYIKRKTELSYRVVV